MADINVRFDQHSLLLFAKLSKKRPIRFIFRKLQSECVVFRNCHSASGPFDSYIEFRARLITTETWHFRPVESIAMCTRGITCATSHVKKAGPGCRCQALYEDVLPNTVDAEGHGIVHYIILLCYSLEYFMY